MKNALTTSAIVLLLGLVAATLGGCRQEPAPPATTEAPPVSETATPAPAGEGVGQKAPDFSVTDIDGNAHSLGDYGGKILVVDFWATYCKPCVKKLREYESLYQVYKAQDVEFLALSMDQSDDVIKGWRELNDVTFPLARLNETTREGFFGKTTLVPIPQMRILDRKGLIRHSFGPDSTTEEVEAAIKALVEEKR